MKKLILSVIVACLFAATSCTNEDYLLYDSGQPNKLSFAQDTVKFNYGFEADKEVDLEIPVNLIGFVSKEGDVTISVVAASGSDAVEGKDYVFTERVLKQDSSVAKIKLDFKKDALTPNKTYKLILELKKNDAFDVTSRVQCIVLFGNDKLEQPRWWKPEMLGVHTQEKHVLFVNLFWKTEELSPAIYKKIAIDYNFGHNLDGTYTRWEQDYTHTLLTIAAFTDFFRRYVTTPMYEYYLESGDPNYEMPNPKI